MAVASTVVLDVVHAQLIGYIGKSNIVGLLSLGRLAGTCVLASGRVWRQPVYVGVNVPAPQRFFENIDYFRDLWPRSSEIKQVNVVFDHGSGKAQHLLEKTSSIPPTCLERG